MKIQYFPITQIFREIKFGILEVLKITIFAILGALNFVNLVYSSAARKIPYVQICYNHFQEL